MANKMFKQQHYVSALNGVAFLLNGGFIARVVKAV